MGLLSVRTLLDFGMALSTAALIADTIKSVYLYRSLVDVSPEKSSESSAASSVHSNTSLSVWSNLYLVWLVYEFLCGGASIETSMGKCKETERLFVYSCLIFSLLLLLASETTASLGIFVAV